MLEIRQTSATGEDKGASRHQIGSQLRGQKFMARKAGNAKTAGDECFKGKPRQANSRGLAARKGLRLGLRVVT